MKTSLLTIILAFAPFSFAVKTGQDEEPLGVKLQKAASAKQKEEKQNNWTDSLLIPDNYLENPVKYMEGIFTQLEKKFNKPLFQDLASIFERGGDLLQDYLSKKRTFAAASDDEQKAIKSPFHQFIYAFFYKTSHLPSFISEREALAPHSSELSLVKGLSHLWGIGGYQKDENLGNKILASLTDDPLALFYGFFGKQSSENLQKAADQGLAIAQNLYGLHLRQNGKNNNSAGQRYYQLAAENGYRWAQLNYAKSLNTRHVDYEKYMTSAAAQNVPDAYLYLGNLNALKKLNKEALDLYREGARLKSGPCIKKVIEELYIDNKDDEALKLALEHSSIKEVHEFFSEKLLSNLPKKSDLEWESSKEDSLKALKTAQKKIKDSIDPFMGHCSFYEGLLGNNVFADAEQYQDEELEHLLSSTSSFIGNLQKVNLHLSSEGFLFSSKSSESLGKTMKVSGKFASIKEENIEIHTLYDTLEAEHKALCATITSWIQKNNGSLEILKKEHCSLKKKIDSLQGRTILLPIFGEDEENNELFTTNINAVQQKYKISPQQWDKNTQELLTQAVVAETMTQNMIQKTQRENELFSPYLKNVNDLYSLFKEEIQKSAVQRTTITAYNYARLALTQ